jgi:hypothetical protein
MHTQCDVGKIEAEDPKYETRDEIEPRTEVGITPELTGPDGAAKVVKVGG